MAEKQALNATFFAFQKRDKMVLLPATVAMLLILILLLGLFVWMSRAAISDYVAWFMTIVKQSALKPGAPPSPEAMAPPASIMSLIPQWFLFQIVYYVLLAAWEAGCLRWMIRGESGGLFGLTLGADTWRVYFTYWMWFLLLLAIYVALLIVGMTVGFSMFAAAASQAKPDAAAVNTSLLIFSLVCVLAAVGFICLAVRFAPAAATSIAAKRFAFFDAWRVTQGRFWGLLGAFALLWLMFFVGYFIVSIGLGVVMATQMVGVFGAASVNGGEASSAQALALLASPAFLVPLLIFYAVVIAAVMTFWVALFGVNARAARLALEEGKITAAA